MIATVDLGGGGLALYQYGIDKRRTRKRIDSANGAGGYTERIYLDGYDSIAARRSRTTSSRRSSPTTSSTAIVASCSWTTCSSRATAHTRAPTDYASERRPFFATGARTISDPHASNSTTKPRASRTRTSTRTGRAHMPPQRAVSTRRRSGTGTRGRSETRRAACAYHGARYYAPWLGRWISRDPSGASAGSNPFLYVANNPIGRVDPNGRDWTDFMRFATSPPTPAPPITNQLKQAARYEAVTGAKAVSIAPAFGLGLLTGAHVGIFLVEFPLLASILGFGVLGGTLTSGQPTIVGAEKMVKQADPTSSQFDPEATAFNAGMLTGGLEPCRSRWRPPTSP